MIKLKIFSLGPGLGLSFCQDNYEPLFEGVTYTLVLFVIRIRWGYMMVNSQENGNNDTA